MKIVNFGNSGSGKSTLAKKLSKQHQLTHLDLDTIAWQKTIPAKRLSFEQSEFKINQFIETNKYWVIEGCYSDLLKIPIKVCDEIKFLNPGIKVCIEHCRNRPWEPHKYESLEAQNNNLKMLINWIQDYERREDEFSLSSHKKLFDNFNGYKIEYTTNKIS